MQWFPTLLGLRHPKKEKYNLQHLVANPFNDKCISSQYP